MGKPGMWSVNLPVWTVAQSRTYVASKAGRCVLILEDLVVDATSYMNEHVSTVDYLDAWMIR